MYDSTASLIRFCANPSAASAATSPATFGSKWRVTMRHGVAPIARAHSATERVGPGQGISGGWERCAIVGRAAVDVRRFGILRDERTDDRDRDEREHEDDSRPGHRASIARPATLGVLPRSVSGAR